MNAKQGVNGYIRRRSSAQLISELDGSRRLSAISQHSLALAFELKRKSLASLKSTPEDLEEGEGSQTDSNAVLVEHEEMSFTEKCVYTSIMLLIHHNFVRYINLLIHWIKIILICIRVLVFLVLRLHLLTSSTY